MYSKYYQLIHPCVFTFHKSENFISFKSNFVTFCYNILYRIIDEVKRVCKAYHERIGDLEDKKFDLEYIVKRKDLEVVRRAAMKQLPFKNSQDLQYFIFLIKLNYFCDMSKCRVVYFDWFN